MCSDGYTQCPLPCCWWCGMVSAGAIGMDEVTRSVPSWSPGAGAAEASELGILFRGLTLLLLLLLELLPAWPGGVTGQPPGGRAGEGVFAAAAYEQLLGA